MAKYSSTLIGTAGVYYVASQLAIRGFHAAVTHGNAPAVDILVGRRQGSSTLALQVKTSHWAARERGRGQYRALHHYEWDLGRRTASLRSDGLFFVFVDLKLLPNGTQKGLPDCYVVPSSIVANDPSSKKSMRPGWHPGVEVAWKYKDNWSALSNYLERIAQSSA